MKIGTIIPVTICLLFVVSGQDVRAQQSSGQNAGGLRSMVTPISNEISYYKNMDDFRRSRGTTLQVISINEFHVVTDFIIEFTGDFNWDLDLYEDYDYYIELSLVKPLYRSLSFNYQRIYGTFVNGPINQFGIRISLFAG